MHRRDLAVGEEYGGKIVLATPIEAIVGHAGRPPGNATATATRGQGVAPRADAAARLGRGRRAALGARPARG